MSDFLPKKKRPGKLRDRVEAQRQYVTSRKVYTDLENRPPEPLVVEPEQEDVPEATLDDYAEEAMEKFIAFSQLFDEPMDPLPFLIGFYMGRDMTFEMAYTKAKKNTSW